MSEIDLNDMKKRMDGAVKNLQTEFTGLRTGRASANLLDPIEVEAYGSRVPLTQVASVSVPEARMLSVQVWDKGMVSAVDKAIRVSGLGLNPQVDGTLLRIPIPELSGERRKELTKIAAKYAENTRISVRNIRRDVIDLIKKQEKSKELGEDQSKKLQDDVQKATDDFIKKVDDLLKSKETDIMKI